MAINRFRRPSMGKNKRGFFLTMIAFVLVSVFFLYFQIAVIQNSQPTSLASTALSNSVSSFVLSLEELYLPNMLQVSLRSSLTGISTYLANGGTFVASANQSKIIYQLVTNGTMYPHGNAAYSNDSLRVLLGTFTELVNSQLNIPLSLNYTPYQFTLSQTSAWSVTAKVTFIYSINHTDLTITNRTIQITSTVPIIGLAEPYSLINSQGFYAPNISQSNISTWNISEFKNMILRREFAANTAAPSYLNRLANLTTASTYGIEFFVDPSIYGFNTAEKNYSYVDYQFWERPWSCIGYENHLYEIDSISDTAQLRYFRLNTNYASRYVSALELRFNLTRVCNS